jgi:hypothetical protein
MSQKFRMPLWFAIPAWLVIIGAIIIFSRPTRTAPPAPPEKTALQKELDEQLYRAIENEHDPVLRSY